MVVGAPEVDCEGDENREHDDEECKEHEGDATLVVRAAYLSDPQHGVAQVAARSMRIFTVEVMVPDKNLFDTPLSEVSG